MPRKAKTTEEQHSDLRCYKGSDDSELDDETESNIDHQLKHNAQIYNSVEYKTLLDLIKKPEFVINEKSSPKTNVIDMYCGDMYSLTNDVISMFFKRLEACRRTGKLITRFCEKQGEYSGIMIDFDIMQDDDDTSVFDSDASVIRMLLNEILKYIRLDPVVATQTIDAATLTAVITRKPKPIKKKVKLSNGSEVELWKNGFHVLFPGIQLQRDVKRFLLRRISDPAFAEELLNAVVPSTKIPNLTHASLIDQHAACVPVFFIGSASKPNSLPYVIHSVHTVKCVNSKMSAVGFKAEPRSDCYSKLEASDTKYNWCYELSLNWQSDKPDRLIHKCRYTIREEYQDELSKMSSNRANIASAFDPNTNQEKINSELVDRMDEVNINDVFVSEIDDNHSELSVLAIHDQEIKYCMALTDILNQHRAEDYNEWFAVICALASKGAAYKVVAERFSRRAPGKFNQAQFDKLWNDLISKRSGKSVSAGYSTGSLYYWAKNDDPERFELYKNRSIYYQIGTDLFSCTLEGMLGNYDVAKILYTCLQYKYVYCRNVDGSESKTGVWYEFIFDGETEDRSEVYKWRRCGTKHPKSMSIYISETVRKIFETVFGKLQMKIRKADDEDYKSFLNMISYNFKTAAKGLSRTTFKNGVAKEAELLFDSYDFCSKLDTDETVMGVGNGLLVLGKETKHITGYHTYKISKHTKVDYKPFDPRDEYTLKVLRFLHSLVPDSERSTIIWLIYYMASCLDNRKKESIFLALVGRGANGKSTLTELLAGVLGDYATKLSIAMILSTERSVGKPTPELCEIDGARFVRFAESNKCETLNMATIKELTGGERVYKRQLYSASSSFVPRSHFLASTNHDFDIQSNDHGTWRRFKYLKLKMTFKPAHELDANNPYERLADPEISDSWSSNDAILSAFLSILVFYYEKLQKEYGGKVLNVPCPTLTRETANYKQRQNPIDQFINRRLVILPDSGSNVRITVDSAITLYAKWYMSHYSAKSVNTKGIHESFENSCLSKFMVRDNRGIVLLKGVRFLEDDDDPVVDGEMLYIEWIASTGCDSKKEVNIISERAITFETYHKELCDECDAIQQKLKTKPMTEIALDSIKQANEMQSSLLDNDDSDLCHHEDSDSASSSSKSKSKHGKKKKASRKSSKGQSIPLDTAENTTIISPSSCDVARVGDRILAKPATISKRR